MSSARRIRVLYVAVSLEIGGSERQVQLLAEHLPRSRFSVNLLLLGGTHEPTIPGVQVRRLGAPPRSGSSLPLFAGRAAGAALSFVRAVQGRYDIVDAWLYHAYALAGATRCLTRIPVLVAGRRSLNDFKAAFGPLDRTIDAIARRNSDVLVANSEAVRRNVITTELIDPRRIRVIRNGVEIPAMMPQAARAAIRSRWSTAPDALVIGCVSNYKTGKGLESLIRVAGRLAQAHRDVRFVLVGEGPLRTALSRAIEANGLSGVVRLHGSEPDARSLYGAFDILVHPSESEGLPNVVLEAAAAGCPIVATAAGGTTEVIEDGRSGVIVPVGEDDALLQGLTLLLSDPQLRSRLGHAARLRATTEFGVDRFVSDFATLYEELANRRGLQDPAVGSSGPVLG